MLLEIASLPPPTPPPTVSHLHLSLRPAITQLKRLKTVLRPT